MFQVTVLPENRLILSPGGESLLDLLRRAGCAPDAPCGGQGKCGKCLVLLDGKELSACRIPVDRDMTVSLPDAPDLQVLVHDIPENAVSGSRELSLAFDIGTTSLVCFLLEGRKTLAESSMLNPQSVFGADVISRIRAAVQGSLARETSLIRDGMTKMISAVCGEAGISPRDISRIAVVGNPAMQQLFLGISPENLVKIPFAPALTEAETVPCDGILPVCPNARLLIVPDISGYIGADTIGCILSTKLYDSDEITLLVDIGTNGELVLGSRERMIACSTAAGPALEGANIRCGMRAAPGAIDHVRLENGQFHCSVIGGGEAVGICGSGLIDAVAAALDAGLLNSRGRILNDERILHLTNRVYLTQEDIRQVQLAKGAIHAGIILMAKALHVRPEDLRKVLLAGAFGSFLNPSSACRIGLIPEQFSGRIEAAGNAAGAGARLLASGEVPFSFTEVLARRVEYLELANLPQFPGVFARATRFREVQP